MRRRWHYCWRRDPNKSDNGDQTDQTWPEYSINGRQVLVLDTDRELQTQTGLRDRYCQFWSESVPRLIAATSGKHLILTMCYCSLQCAITERLFCFIRLFIVLIIFLKKTNFDHRDPSADCHEIFTGIGKCCSFDPQTSDLSYPHTLSFEGQKTDVLFYHISHCGPVVLSADNFSAKKRLSVNL